MVTRKALWLLLGGVLGVWCATAAPAEPEYEVRIPRTIEKFYGFSVLVPADKRWRLRRDDQSPHVATFYFEPLSPTHSFNATVLIRGLPTEFRTEEEFHKFIDSKIHEHDVRFEELSSESKFTKVHGQWAVRYQCRFVDTEPANSPTPLVMTLVEVLYLHPYMQRTVIDAFYSERGTEKDLDGVLPALRGFLD